MGLDIAENLFLSIDTIVKARLANLSYDLTLECEIINTDKADEGKYLVQYQASLFYALSTDKTYEKGDIVYVQVPQGDFTKDKNIINKKIEEEDKTKKLSFLSFVKGENLFSQRIYNTEYSLTVTGNGSEGTKKTFTINGPFAGFTKFGIRSAIKAELNDVISGNYGLKIELIGYDLATSVYQGDIKTDGNKEEVGAFYDIKSVANNLTSSMFESEAKYLKALKELESMNDEAIGDFTSIISSLGIDTSSVTVNPYFLLDTSEMIGVSPYDTKGYCMLEKVIDITNKVITSIRVTIWQDGNFKNSNGDAVSSARVFFKNLACFVGYDTSEFSDSSIRYLLYTTLGLQYNMVDNDNVRKTMLIRGVQQSSNDKYTYVLEETFDSKIFSFYWEKYTGSLQEKGAQSNLLGYKTVDTNDNRNNTSSYTAKLDLTEVSKEKVTYVAVVINLNTGDKYVTNTLSFLNSVYTDSMIAFHDSTGVFYVDNDGYLFINGGADDAAETALAIIRGALIEDSTLSDITLADELKSSNLKITLNFNITNSSGKSLFNLTSSGTLYAEVTNYAQTGTIKQNFERIKAAIDRLGGVDYYEIV